MNGWWAKMHAIMDTSVAGTFPTSQAVAATSDVEGEADEGRAPLDFRI
jgi:hypothetical protein